MRRRFAVLLFLILPFFSAPTTAADTDSGPRTGKYLVLSYGATGKPPLNLGYFVLEKGKYKAYLPGDKPSGSGDWQYDAAQKKVVWKSGPYAGVWDGKFEIDRGGKTHKIRMKSTTIGTNSID
jgi:hypothetical protein